jgi:hypothetical protein
MDHATFVEEYRSGTLSIHVDRSGALRIMQGNMLPKRYRAAHHFWTWIWMLSFPGFIAVAVFYKWWVGLILLIFVTPTISRSITQSACEFVLEHALEDEGFFRLVSQNELISIERRTVKAT